MLFSSFAVLIIFFLMLLVCSHFLVIVEWDQTRGIAKIVLSMRVKKEMTGHMAPSLIPVFQLFCSLQKTFQALEKSSPFHNVPCRSPSPDRSIYRYASQYCLPPLARCIIVVCSINDSMPLKLSVVIIHCAINCFGKLYEVSGYNTGK